MALVYIETTADFEKRIEDARNSLVVVHFSAQWAPQCKQMENVLQELTKDSTLGDVHFLQLEAESLPEISEKYSITAVPTFVFIRNNRMIETINGANAPEVTKALRRHVNGPNANGVERGSSQLNSSASSSKEDLNIRLKNLVSAAPCMLFMKGTPKEPKCGFSRQIIDLLNKTNADYGSFDILSDESVRQGLKEYSKWPTYPQLYVNGELIGGLDIVKELDESGEFETMLPKKQNLNDRLKALVNKSKVMVFMKGEPKNPRCGFSKQLVAILNSSGVTYDTFDILSDEEVRQGLKSFSNWPTYPQVYVEGNFIGGMDIVKELQETGELLSTLQPTNN